MGRNELICGVDEAGRGPLAGPVVAAAVILNSDISIENLTDSKLLQPAQRYRAFLEIIDKADDYAIAGVSWTVIDSINILKASLLAMKHAVANLDRSPDLVYVDGNYTIPGLKCRQEAVVHGDRLIPQVSAASILAKVARDIYMYKISKTFPEYGFDRHKGYSTPEHLMILKEIGPCPIHRKSYSPVSQLSFWKDN